MQTKYFYIPGASHLLNPVHKLYAVFESGVDNFQI